MQRVLEATYPLRVSDFDCRRQLQPAGVLDLFQDAAGRHSADMGIGFDTMLEQHKMWILSGVQYRVIQTPNMYQTVRLHTWPLAPGAVTFRREYRMEDLQGNVLVLGTSDWAIIDSEKRKLLPAKGMYPFDSGFSEEKCFAEKMPHLRDFEPEREGMKFIPRFSQLDMNGHVNNTKYANFVLDALALKPQETIDTFQIHYQHELRLDQAVTVYTKRVENLCFAMGKNDGNETMFHCQIKLNQN